jgi:hypothetical protein
MDKGRATPPIITSESSYDYVDNRLHKACSIARNFGFAKGSCKVILSVEAKLVCKTQPLCVIGINQEINQFLSLRAVLLSNQSSSYPFQT